MNDASLHTNSTLATALRILSEQVAPESAASAEWSDALVAALLPLLPPSPPAPADLIAPHNNNAPGLRWHADQLLALCRSRTTPRTSRAGR